MLFRVTAAALTNVRLQSLGELSGLTVYILFSCTCLCVKGCQCFRRWHRGAPCQGGFLGDRPACGPFCLPCRRCNCGMSPSTCQQARVAQTGAPTTDQKSRLLLLGCCLAVFLPCQIGRNSLSQGTCFPCLGPIMYTCHARCCGISGRKTLLKGDIAKRPPLFSVGLFRDEFASRILRSLSVLDGARRPL